MLLMLCAFNAVAAGANGNVYIEDTDRFPGWKGELPRPVADNTIGYGEGGVVCSCFQPLLFGPSFPGKLLTRLHER